MKQRVVSAIIASIIFIPLVIIGGIWFELSLILLSLLAFRELNIVASSNLNKFIYFISNLVIIFLILSDKINIELNSLICLIMLILFLPIIFYNKESYNINDALKNFSKVIFIGFSFSLIRYYRLEDIWLLVYLFAVSSITDTVAYLVGSNFGKIHICPRVSPKKTLEGSIGGTLAGTILGTIIYIFYVDPACNILLTLFVTLILSLVGQLGDLFFSQIKRCYGVKDFSNIMPGHGGVLDRLDSLIFVVMCFNLISGLL